MKFIFEQNIDLNATVLELSLIYEKLEELKKEMMKFKDEVVKAADALNERGDLLEEMQAKATNLVNDSYEFKDKATQVRKTECKKKLFT